MASRNRRNGQQSAGGCFSEHPQSCGNQSENASGDLPAMVAPLADPTPQSIWIDKMRDFQKQWASTVSDIARKHRDVIDKQYQAAIESLDAALRCARSRPTRKNIAGAPSSSAARRSTACARSPKRSFANSRERSPSGRNWPPRPEPKQVRRAGSSDGDAAVSAAGWSGDVPPRLHATIGHTGATAMKIDNKVALVTGAASGIGRAVAELVKRGARTVVLVDRSDVGLRSRRNDQQGGRPRGGRSQGRRHHQRHVSHPGV